jgi:protein phosphatase-4 regulatory subunit 3
VRQKIHYTYRLQYLKDVVLARILDDPTFSVLNSLIFFNQIEIVSHIQSNVPFIRELFSPFTMPKGDELKMRNTVLFIQQCCSIAKGLQLNIRAQLFSNFLGNGLFNVITYALKHPLANIRVGGTEVLIAVIEHDALLMRSQIFKAVQEKQRPITDTLIELLLDETDLSVKAQISEAIKILIDPNINIQSLEALNRNNGDIMGRSRNIMQSQASENLVQHFYDDAARKIFRPLKELEGRESSKF